MIKTENKRKAAAAANIDPENPEEDDAEPLPVPDSVAEMASHLLH